MVIACRLTALKTKLYESIAKSNYERLIANKPLTDDNLERYFNGCFKDVGQWVPLALIWVCPNCFMSDPRKMVLDLNYGYGDNIRKCKNCQGRTYMIGNFQARSSIVGNTFEYACYHLLTERFKIKMTISSERSRLYDLEVKPNVVIEVKGSPKYIVNNVDGVRLKMPEPGMQRSDTEKKAFRNAEQWHNDFPDGHFFILTNAVPNHLIGRRTDKVRAIVDVTREKELTKFVDELKSL